MKRRTSSTRKRQKKSQGIIALLTDFGDRDHYVGTMKGVILSLNPHARIVDITHNVQPQCVDEAAYLLWASYHYFPGGTVFTCVVDPGVGSKRKIICVETDRYSFVAPENGLLDFIVQQENVRQAVEVVHADEFGLKPISTTFHGRDIFAPLAALISLGKPLSRFGTRHSLKDPPRLFFEPERDARTARVLHIDRFGNIVTNIPKEYFEAFEVKVGTTTVTRRIHNYSEAPKGLPCLIVGSSGLIEIAVGNGSASTALRANLETPVVVLGVKGQSV